MFLKGMCEGSKARGYPMTEDVSGEGVHSLWGDHRVRNLREHGLQSLGDILMREYNWVGGERFQGG